METVVWVGIRIVVPRGRPDRLRYLVEISRPMTVYRLMTPCGRRIAYALDDIPATDVRCLCGEEFLVQWADGE